MFGKFFFTVLTAVSLSACAEPRYMNESETNENGQTAKENKADCSVAFVSSGICLSWYWEQKPTSSEVGSLIFKTYRLNSLDQTPVETDTAQTPTLILWMPSMGHGSTPTQTVRVDVGTYRSTNVFFVMPGEWDMKFQIKNGTEILDEAKVSLTF